MRNIYGAGVYITDLPSGVWCDGIAIVGCEITRMNRQGIAVVGGRNIAVTDCWIHDGKRSAIDLEPNTEQGGCVNLTVSDCRFANIRFAMLTSAGYGGTVSHITFDGVNCSGQHGLVQVYVRPTIGASTQVTPIASSSATWSR